MQSKRAVLRGPCWKHLAVINMARVANNGNVSHKLRKSDGIKTDVSMSHVRIRDPSKDLNHAPLHQDLCTQFNNHVEQRVVDFVTVLIYP